MSAATPEKDVRPTTSSEKLEGGNGVERELGGMPVVGHVLTRGLDEAARRHGFQTLDGRYVLDPDEARREFGDDVAATLQLTRDGAKVLWPQPRGDADPQSWPLRKKWRVMLAISLAGVAPDFSSAVGIASLFNLAKQFDTSVHEINNLTSNSSIFLLGPGGIVVCIFAIRYGRLPAYFWSQLLGMFMQLGCTLSNDLPTYAVFRCLNAWFTTSGQVLGLLVITDIWPVHLQSTMIAVWTLAYVGGPFLPPWLLGYLTASQSWRWAYGIGTMYLFVVVLAIVFLMDETMYDRHLDPIPPAPTRHDPAGLAYRLEKLVGLAGLRMARRHQRPSLGSAAWRFVDIAWRPHFLLPMALVAVPFGSAIGLNVLHSTFMVEFFDMGPIGRSTTYITPLVGAVLGELAARLLVKWSTRYSLKRNHGVLEAEDLYIPTVPGVLAYFVGLLMYGLGAKRKILALMIVGWGCAQMGIVIILVAIMAYESLAFPGRDGELGALINQVRTLYGFSIPFFQPPWIERSGPLVPFVIEGALGLILWMVLIPALYAYGPKLRARFSIKHDA